jgi:hypothetical protein
VTLHHGYECPKAAHCLCNMSDSDRYPCPRCTKECTCDVALKFLRFMRATNVYRVSVIR